MADRLAVRARDAEQTRALRETRSPVRLESATPEREHDARRGCSARSGDLQTFIVLIASCACSIVSTLIHSVVWGSKSWFMISILSSEVLIDASAAILKFLNYCGRNGAAGHFCSEIWIMDLQLRGGSRRRLSVAGLVVLRSKVCRWPMLRRPGSGAH